jgi:hypothetical protein
VGFSDRVAWRAFSPDRLQLPEVLDKSGFLVVPPYYLMDLGDSRWVSPLVLIEPEALFD